MFANAYQNGPCLQVWDSKVDPSKNSFYKHLSKSIPHSARAFDKQAKSYLHTFQGQHSKISLPSQQSKSLALHQRYLVLQIFIPLGMTDLTNLKRRVNLTTVQGKQQGKYFSYRYPLQVTKGSWLFLAIDVYSFMQVFKGQTFRSLDHITIGSWCRLRRIFTMKQFVQYQIPNGFWLTNQLPQSLQLIVFKEQNKSLMPSRLMTQSISAPFEEIKKSVSGNKVQNKSESPVKKSPIKSPKINSNLGRSQFIIQNARQRLNNLQKQQELLLQKSIHLENDTFKVPKFNANSRVISNSSNSRVKKQTIHQQISGSSSPKSPQSKTKVKSKLPPLDRSFRQDQALYMPQSQSSVPTQEHHHYQRKFLESKQEVIEEQSWLQKSENQDTQIRGIFPSTLITRENAKEVKVKGDSGQLQLIYDQMVGCYYHPQTNTYYQIKK